MRPIRLYLFGFTALVASGLGATAAINYVVDPYLVYFTPPITGLTEVKTEQHRFLHLSKAHAIATQHPTGIILGTSVAALGLDPNHPSIRAAGYYNAGLPGATSTDIRAYFEHAEVLGPLHSMILALDLSSFNALRVSKGGDTGKRLATLAGGYTLLERTADVGETLFSFETLLNSARTVRHQDLPVRFLANGHGAPNGSYRTVHQELGGHRLAMISVEQNFMNRVWRAPPMGLYCFEWDGVSTLDNLQAILDVAYARGIATTILLLPSHARTFEAMWQSGVWPAFENWKREIVVRNERSAAAAQQNPFAVWDFTAAVGPNVEEVPPLGDAVTEMQYHWEASHHRPALGNLVLDRVFGEPEQLSDPDFGVRLLAAALDGHLARLRNLQAAWRSAHGIDVREIVSNAPPDAAAQTGYCQSQVARQ